MDSYWAQGKPSPDNLDDVMAAYERALSDVPDRHLSDCFENALKNSRSSFVPAAGEVLAQWDILLAELRDQAGAVAQREMSRLQAGQGSLDRMGLDEWKRRHNLGAEWKLGDPYPPESDLYNVPVPHRHNTRPTGRPPTSPFWYQRQKAPWELYPPEENPEVRKVMVRGLDGKRRTITFVWWVQRCRGARCQGWVDEHVGPMGSWVRHRMCPLHFEGQPEPPNYTIVTAQPEPPGRDEWDVIPEEEARAMWENYSLTATTEQPPNQEEND